VLAWNRVAAALGVDWGSLPPEQRNAARYMFLDEGACELYPDWEQGARGAVAYLRFAAGRYPDDSELAALVGELSVKSAEFRRWWPDHDVRAKSHGRKRLHPPDRRADHDRLGEFEKPALIAWSREDRFFKAAQNCRTRGSSGTA
jgi:hypothetical protein